MEFKDYWRQHCPTANRKLARKLWNMYEDVSEVSTDFEKEDMNGCYNIPSIATSIIQMDACTSFSLAPLLAATPCYPAECNKSDLESYIRPNKQKGNNPMYVDNDKHIESSKINYLAGRADEALFASEDKINDAFNLRKPKAPETPEDLVTAITSGNYTIPPKTERNSYDRAVNQIVWRAPTVVADEAGAKVARDAFRSLYTSAKDAIMISTPAEALTAVQALNAWTPVAGTVAS